MPPFAPFVPALSPLPPSAPFIPALCPHAVDIVDGFRIKLQNLLSTTATAVALTVRDSR